MTFSKHRSGLEESNAGEFPENWMAAPQAGL